MNIAMIPARMGSQRLKKKNLCMLGGMTLIERAVRKCKTANCFDEIWINSEDLAFRDIAIKENVQFHQRPQELGNNISTSEEYITEFLENHTCTNIFQVHSIAPLMTVDDIVDFCNFFNLNNYDCLMSTEDIQIECVFENKPINF